jgi:replicative DNA helicase
MIGGEVSQSEYLAESEVVGKAFADNRILNELGNHISCSDFNDSRLSTIWGAVVDLHTQGLSVDPVSVANRLETDGRLNECGGIAFIVSLDTQVSGVLSDAYARIIKAGSKRRRISALCADLVDSLHTSDDIDSLVALHIDSLMAQSTDGRVVHHHLKETVNRAVEQTRERFSDQSNSPGVATGYGQLDDILGGWSSGCLYICSAGTGQGKSALALNFTNSAIRNGNSVVYVSLEMEAVDLAKRLISIRSCINGEGVRTGRLNQHEIESMLQGVKSLTSDEGSSLIIDKPGIGVSELMAEMRKIHSRQEIDMVIVDYIQLMQCESTYSREREVAGISAGLVAMSKLFDCAVLALSQVNDSGQIRESRAVEHDATAIMRIDYEDPENAPFDLAPDVKLSVLKNRHGRTGSIPMTFVKPTQTFAIRRD